MKDNWIKLEDIVGVIYKSLEQSNEKIMNTDSDQSYVITEFSIDMNVYTRIDGEHSEREMYFLFPTEEDMLSQKSGITHSGPSRISFSVKPTVKLITSE